jgi:uncharacterized protein
MRIGLLSDTHDKLPAMADAMRQLQERQAEFFIHCGDVGNPSVLDYLAGLPAAFVWGNCDWDRAGLSRYAAQVHVPCHGPFADLELAGKRIAVIHGDDTKLKRQLLTEQRHDFLFQGHTHIREDTTVGNVRIINPGALHRANPKTAALLDTETGRLDYLVVTV